MKNKLLVLLFAMVLFSLTGKTYAQNSDLEITYRQNNDNSVDFNYRKTMHGNVYVSIKFDDLQNASQNRYQGCLQSHMGKVFTLKPRNPDSGIGFSYSYRYQRGKPIFKLKEDFVYLLPFKNSVKVQMQKMGYLGKRFGRGAPESWTAFQFCTDSLESVLAARRGLVVDVTDEYSIDTTKNSIYRSSVNEVIIEHKDGTMAHYSGFKKGSICVKPGQYVYPNEELGKTGRNNSEQNYKLHFYIYYLNTRDIFDLRTKEDKMNIYAFVNPCFHWQGGESIILPRNSYVAECTEELIMQEFSRREKKKYQKRQLN